MAAVAGDGSIFCHQISCLELIYRTCKFDDERESSGIFKINGRDIILVLLDLTQNIEMSLKVLLKRVQDCNESYGSVIAQLLFKRLNEFIKDKGVELLDFFHSLESLTLNGNPYLQRTSLLGLFVRRILLKYKMMTFEQIGQLGKRLEIYVQTGKSFIDKLKDNSTIEDVSMEEESESVKGEEEEVSKCVKGDSAIKDEVEDIMALSQVDRFISQQARQLQSGTSLSPLELQEKIKHIIQRFPNFAEAHYLCYLNYLRVNEVKKALFELHQYFDYKKFDEECENTNSTDKTFVEKHQMSFKRFRYCALNLGIFHFLYGHAEESLTVLQEAVRMAQETNDHECLEHALFWLQQLQSECEPKQSKAMLDRFTAKAKELALPELQGLGMLMQCRADAFIDHEDPQTVMVNLNKTESLKPISMDLTCKIQVQRSALLDFYGLSSIASSVCQMTLYENPQMKDNRSPISLLGLTDFGSCDIESQCMSLCQLAKFHADEGMFDVSSSILDHATSSISSYSRLQKWMTVCRAQIEFGRSILERDLGLASKAANTIQLIDKDDAKYRNCIISMMSGNNMETAVELDKLFEKSKNNHKQMIGYTPSPLYHARLLLLYGDLYASINELSKAASYLLECLAISRQFHMKNIEASATICICLCKIQLGLPDQALELLKVNMVYILSHGTLYIRCLASLTLVKCELACLRSNPSKDKISVYQSLLPSLERCLSGFDKIKAFNKVSDTLYIMARIHDALDHKSERNRCAKEFRTLNQKMSNSFSSSFLL